MFRTLRPVRASRSAPSGNGPSCSAGPSCVSRADGTEASRVLVTPQERTTSAERNLEDLAGLAAVAIVGVNIGDIDLRSPFDPDETPFEPHGYVVTLAPSP